MKTLMLMRHAKSDWSAEFSNDHERPLNDRGVKSARIMGEVLADRGLAPDLVISSTAVRARTTAELAKEAGSWRSSIRLEPQLYMASPDTVVSIAAGAPAIERLMLVGHQPTWSTTVDRLTGSHVAMKTATVAIISAPIESWSSIAAGPFELLDVLYPRDFLH